MIRVECTVPLACVRCTVTGSLNRLLCKPSTRAGPHPACEAPGHRLGSTPADRCDMGRRQLGRPRAREAEHALERKNRGLDFACMFSGLRVNFLELRAGKFSARSREFYTRSRVEQLTRPALEREARGRSRPAASARH